MLLRQLLLHHKPLQYLKHNLIIILHLTNNMKESKSFGFHIQDTHQGILLVPMSNSSQSSKWKGYS